MSSISATEARKNLFNIIEKASKPGNEVTISVNGEAKVIIMSKDEYEGWLETLEIMSDKKMMKSIQEGLADIKKGRVYTHEEVKKKLKIN